MRFIPLLILATVCAFAIGRAEENTKAFDLPANDATDTLRRFAQQAGREVVYPAEEVRGFKTNAVRGTLSVNEALRLLLDGTGLVAHSDPATGAIAVRRDSPRARNNEAPPPPPNRPSKNSSGSSDTAADGDILELSPFHIAAQSDTGWIANETLAGSRLRTEFRDVPNQIETLTKDFMTDFGLATLDEALIYTANVENNSEFISQNPGDQVTFPNNSGRVRGIGLGTLTRNFFKTAVPTDNFNIERATIASGPNAILFGLGSPAGILDATPARAQNRRRYGIEMRYDSNQSKYAKFDANLPVLPNKLQFRLMGMSKKSYTEKKPNLDRNDRLYGTLTFKPFANTTLILQGERSSRSWNAASRLAPVDFVTPWYTADRIPGSGYTSARPIYDNSSLTGIGNNRIFAQASDGPVIIQGGGVGVRNWRNSVTVRSPATLPGVEPTFDSGSIFTLLDDSLFPLDVNIMGSSRVNQMKGDIKTVMLEQKVAQSLFLELAYNRETSSNFLLASGGQVNGNNYPLYVDANKYIPGTSEPNPFLGKLYFQGATADRLQYFENDTWRATLSYELTPARDWRGLGSWGKWLGRHRFAGMYTGSRDQSLDQSGFIRRILDDPVIPGLSLRPKSFQNWATHATRIPQVRHYFLDPYEPTSPAGPFFGDWTMYDANGKPYVYYKFDTPLVSADGKRLSAQSPAGGGLSRTDAVMIAWQGFFLPDREGRDRLVTTYGYRKDTSMGAVMDASSIKQDFSGLYPGLWDTNFGPYGESQSGINRNLGAVVRPLAWLSLSYNQSTTFNLNVGRFDPFGYPLRGAGGDGQDYGMRLDLWSNRLSVKINKYRTILGPQRASNQINGYTSQFASVENRILELDPSTPRLHVSDGTLRGFPTMGVGAYNISSHAESKGYEVELNFTPTENWNVRLNGTKSEATESGIGRDWLDWLQQRLPVWQSVVAKNGEVDAEGKPVTWKTAPYSASSPNGQTLDQYYQNTIVGQALAFISAVDGRANPFVRGARLNAIINRRFSSGWLKGFNLGGAFRWRAAPVIGYGIKTSPGGITVLDLDRVYKGKAERFVDLNIGYRNQLKAFGFSQYRLQLNIRNLLNENDPIPAGALTTGATYRIATLDSRVTTFTFGVDF